MGSNQVTKRCHWVPQAYLRAFTADPRERKVWRFSKNAGEPELKDIEKVAVRFHLYVPQGSDGRRDDSLEKKLAALEQLFQSPVWMSLRNDYVDLSGEPLRKMVSVLAATMFLRNPNHFTMVRNMHTRFVDLFSELGGPPSYIEINGQELTLDSGEWPGYRDASDDDLKRLWISEINVAAEYAQLLMSMRWSMICSDTPVFITTDNPVVFLHPSLTFRGINNPETTVIFPISPTRVLCMDHLHHEPKNQYYPLKGAGAAQNSLMWRSSIEHMFSNRHPDIVCAELMDDAELQGLG